MMEFPKLCSLTYIMVDMAIEQIIASGRGILWAKINIKNAFRLLPVHPADCHLLSWILEKKGVSPIMHYLDNFLTLGPPESPIC